MQCATILENCFIFIVHLRNYIWDSHSQGKRTISRIWKVTLPCRCNSLLFTKIIFRTLGIPKVPRQFHTVFSHDPTWLSFFLSRKKYFRAVIRKLILSDGAESYYCKNAYSLYFYVEYKFFQIVWLCVWEFIQ